MTIKLNVMVTTVVDDNVVTVWADDNCYLPRLSLYYGTGCCLTSAILSYRDNLPPYFIIDDETVVYSKDFGFELKEPIMSSHNVEPRAFVVC